MFGPYFDPLIPVSYLISLYRKIKREIRHFFMKLGISLEDFATSYSSDKAWFNKEYEQQSKHRGKANPKLGWKIPWGLISVRKLVWSLVNCFHPDFSFHPQFQQQWDPVSPVWSGLWSLSNWYTHLRDCLPITTKARILLLDSL